FVPPFTSQSVADWAARYDSVARSLRAAHGGDKTAFARDSAAWVSANPVPRATLSQVADHIDHIRDVAGVDHVGIGSDFDGITTVVQGLEDVSKFPALFAELAHRGWSDADLRKLAGENLLRVFSQAEAVARRLQASGRISELPRTRPANRLQ